MGIYSKHTASLIQLWTSGFDKAMSGLLHEPPQIWQWLPAFSHQTLAHGKVLGLVNALDIRWRLICTQGVLPQRENVSIVEQLAPPGRFVIIAQHDAAMSKAASRLLIPDVKAQAVKERKATYRVLLICNCLSSRSSHACCRLLTQWITWESCKELWNGWSAC